MSQVFISYSRKDLGFVHKLASDLKNAGLDVWYDVSGIGGGAKWRIEIENALKKSQYVIVVLSPDSINSEWVEREFLFSNNLKLKIIPLMYRLCDLPLTYVDLNYIDVQGNNYIQNFNSILESFDIEPEDRKKPRILDRSSLLKGVGVVVIILFFSVLAYWKFGPQDAEMITSPPVIMTEMISATTLVSDPTIVPTLTPTDFPSLPAHTPIPTLSNAYWISYTSKQNGTQDIFVQNPVTKETKEIITDTSHDKVGDWSVDGNLLVFESSRDNSFYHIYLYNSVQGFVNRLTSLAECSNWAPHWSSDSTKIVFYSNCENQQRDIYIMNRDGSGRVKITNDKGENRFPVFSPDDSLITFTSTRNGKDQIFIMNVDGSDQHFVADGCNSTFSPDGEWLWFSTYCDDSDIKRVRVDGSDLMTVGTLFGENPVVSPDGFFVVFEAGGNIWIIRIDGSGIEQLTSDGLNSAPSWKQ